MTAMSLFKAIGPAGGGALWVFFCYHMLIFLPFSSGGYTSKAIYSADHTINLALGYQLHQWSKWMDG